MTARVWRACSAFSHVALALALLLAFVLPAAADVAVPQLTGRVVDQTGTLSSSDVAALTQKLRDYE
ncbi:hypothetical protein KBX21_26385, partial [Nocardiopsis sp. B62]|nr:hypothetical protein [Nocardiopsis sp. B62]